MAARKPGWRLAGVLNLRLATKRPAHLAGSVRVTVTLKTPLVAAASVLALLWVPSAAAHAFLVRSNPAAGSAVVRAPSSVRLSFDEGVRPAPGIEVVRNGGGSVLAGRPFVPPGKPTEIVLPLRPHLHHGAYTIRWREIDVDDGHLIVGVFAFKVGSGGP